MKLRDIPKPETLEKKYRGKICPEGLQVLKSLLELDPAKRPSAETVMSHSYFDDVRVASAKDSSPRGVTEKRVHSSTYRTSKYNQVEGEDEIDATKRHPSHSQERRSYIRAAGVFGTHDMRMTETNDSRLSVNQREDGHSLGEKKRSFASTRTGGFMIKDSQVASSRKEGSAYSKKDEKDNSNENRGLVSGGGRKRMDPKKSIANFKMFRIRKASLMKVKK